MFMKEGEITDTGTHEKLMEGDNEYASLIKMFYTQETEEEANQNRPGNYYVDPLYCLTLCMLGNFSCSCCRLLTFFKIK